jgi:hypothetical protein
MPKKQKSSSGGSTKRKPWVDPDDAPELTDEMLDRAEISEGDRIIRPGRPAARHPAAQRPAAPRAKTQETMMIAEPFLVLSRLQNIPVIGTFRQELSYAQKYFIQSWRALQHLH